MGKKQTHMKQQDLTHAVDEITAQFYRDSGSATVDDRSMDDLEINGSSNNTTDMSDVGNPPIDTYLAFSATHRGSNQLLIGVLLFFFLIVGVWGFLWYQTVLSTPLGESFDMSIINQAGDDISSLFAQLQTDIDTETTRSNEAVLKADLSVAIQQQLQGMGTSTNVGNAQGAMINE